MKFSTLIKQFRAKRGFEKTELAQKIGMKTGNYLGDVESGRVKPPTMERCRQIAQALRLSKEESDQLILAAAQERVAKEELDIIRGTIDAMVAPLKGSPIRGASSCPHCSREIEFEIDGKGEVVVSGKVTAKVRRL